ncbi:MAG: hypothetical protein JXB48_18165 [Candidatus Latescibacteria bacterium]|nr:hypothetical protein [Candidatus Latescibacterota bacterium]
MNKKFIVKNTLIFAFMLTLLVSQANKAYTEEVSRADSLIKAKKHFSFAVQYKNNEKYDDAFRNYEASIAYNDTVYQVHYSFADLLIKMDNIPYAKREFLTVFTLNPNHYKSIALLSKFYFESADYDSALIMYENMYRLQPEQLTILESIASLREHTGKIDDALDAYSELIAKGNDNYSNNIKAATFAEKLEKYETARDFAIKALEKKPDDIDALNIAIQTSLALNDTESAINYLQRISQVDAADTKSLIRLENLYRSGSDIEQLIATLKEHHKRMPDDADIIEELAERLMQTEKPDESIEFLRKGIEIAPDNGKFHILLGNYYQEKGDNQQALREYGLALKDAKWKSSAQQFIWQIEEPETASEKAEREFFNRPDPKNQ